MSAPAPPNFRSSEPAEPQSNRPATAGSASNWPKDRERRRHGRFPVALDGRYMLDDGTEFPCRTEDISLSGVGLRGAPAGAIGEWVVAYVRELGRIEGVVVRRTPVWFALELRTPPLKKLRLASVIDRLARGGSETRADRPSIAEGCAPGGAG